MHGTIFFVHTVNRGFHSKQKWLLNQPFIVTLIILVAYTRHNRIKRNKFHILTAWTTVMTTVSFQLFSRLICLIWCQMQSSLYDEMAEAKGMRSKPSHEQRTSNALFQKEFTPKKLVFDDRRQLLRWMLNNQAAFSLSSPVAGTAGVTPPVVGLRSIRYQSINLQAIAALYSIPMKLKDSRRYLQANHNFESIIDSPLRTS